MAEETLEAVLEAVRERVTPTPAEEKRILQLAEKFKAKLCEALERLGLPAEVRLEGSIAKGTWLRGDADIDIFMLVPEDTPRSMLASEYLRAARLSLRGRRIVERFAEHPYVEAQVAPDVRVNIVPCYKVKPPHWKSATDRTPYHTAYIRAKLNHRLAGEVRLLKRFMKGVGVYGSDIKTGGFSGYLAELLTLAYKGFTNVLKAASRWKPGELLDLEGFYRGREDEARSLFEPRPLLVVDPVDSRRNVASPLRREAFDSFRAASRLFLENPRLSFFYPPEVKPFKPGRLRETLKRRGCELAAVHFWGVKAVPDILWGQLYKTERALRKLLEAYGFNVLRSACWSDEKSRAAILFEVETVELSGVKRHLGPEILSESEQRFLAKYLREVKPVAGPYIENGRWTVIVRRSQTSLVNLLKDALSTGGREVGVASRLAEACKRKRFKILKGVEILSLYRENSGFQVFLTSFLLGRPPWLDVEGYPGTR